MRKYIGIGLFTLFLSFNAVAAPVPPQNGGSGISNNPANTVTFTGAFGLTWTLTGPTNLTLPTSGTVATLSDVDTVSLQAAYGFGTPGALGSINLTSNNLNPFATFNSYNGGNQEQITVVNSAASSPTLWGYGFRAVNSSSNFKDFAHIYANVENNLAGSESGSLGLYTASYGTLTQAMILDGSSQDVGIFWPAHIPNGTQTYSSLQLLTEDVSYAGQFLGYTVVSDDVSAHNIDLPATYYSTNADDTMQFQTQDTYAISITPAMGVSINGSNSVVTIPIQTLATLRLTNAAAKAWELTEESTNGGGGGGNVNVTDDNSTDAPMFPLWVSNISGSEPTYVSSTGLQWNPGENILTLLKDGVNGYSQLFSDGQSSTLTLRTNNAEGSDVGAVIYTDPNVSGETYTEGILGDGSPYNLPYGVFGFWENTNNEMVYAIDPQGSLPGPAQYPAMYFYYNYISFPNATSANGLVATDGDNYLTGSTSGLTPQFMALNLGTSSPSSLDSSLNIYSDTQLQARLTLTGQDYYGAYNETEGIGFLLGVNNTDDRQLWIVDTANSAPSPTNAAIRIFSESTPRIDALSTDGSTAFPLYLGNAANSTPVVINASAVNIPSLSINQLVATDGSNNLVSAGAIPSSGSFTQTVSNVSNTSTLSSTKAFYSATNPTAGQMIDVVASGQVTATNTSIVFSLSNPVGGATFSGTGEAAGVCTLWNNTTPGQSYDIDTSSGQPVLVKAAVTIGTYTFNCSYKYVMQ